MGKKLIVDVPTGAEESAADALEDHGGYGIELVHPELGGVPRRAGCVTLHVWFYDRDEAEAAVASFLVGYPDANPTLVEGDSEPD